MLGLEGENKMKESKFNKAYKIGWLILGCVFIMGAATQGGKIIQGIIQLTNYVTSTNANRTHEINGLDQMYVAGNLVTFTNLTGTNDYYVDMAGYRYIGFQFADLVDSPVIKIYCSVQDDSVAPGDASRDYTDISNDAFGAPSWNADDVVAANDQEAAVCKYIKVEIVATGSEDGRVDFKKWW